MYKCAQRRASKVCIINSTGMAMAQRVGRPGEHQYSTDSYYFDIAHLL